MAEVTINAFGDEVGLAGYFCVANKFHVAEVFAYATEKNDVYGNGRDSKQSERERRSAGCEQIMAEQNDEYAADRPRAEAGNIKGRADSSAPEFCEWMKDEPIDWDGQVSEENEESEIAEESHGP
jgi:hypothetical protein